MSAGGDLIEIQRRLAFGLDFLVSIEADGGTEMS